MAKSFTAEEREILESSTYVKSVGETQLAFEKGYHYQLFSLMDDGIEFEEALDKLGTPLSIIGETRAKAIKDRALAFGKKGKLVPPSSVNEQMTESDAVKRIIELEQEHERLKQENEFLKRKRQIDQKYR